jgi:hypothetical protein
MPSVIQMLRNDASPGLTFSRPGFSTGDLVNVPGDMDVQSARNCIAAGGARIVTQGVENLQCIKMTAPYSAGAGGPAPTALNVGAILRVPDDVSSTLATFLLSNNFAVTHTRTKACHDTRTLKGSKSRKCATCLTAL